jgi:PAS domain S-box-containing protein
MKDLQPNSEQYTTCCKQQHDRRYMASLIGIVMLLVIVAFLLPGVMKKDRDAARSQALSALVANLDQAYIVVGPDMTVEFWSLSAEQMFGVPEEKVIGKPMEWMVPPDLREAHRRGSLRWFNSPDSTRRTFDCTALTWDGSPLHITMKMRGCYCADEVWRLVVQCEPQAVKAAEIQLPPRTSSVDK